MERHRYSLVSADLVGSSELIHVVSDWGEHDISPPCQYPYTLSPTEWAAQQVRLAVHPLNWLLLPAPMLLPSANHQLMPEPLNVFLNVLSRHYHCLTGSALTGSWSQEPEPSIKPRNPNNPYTSCLFYSFMSYHYFFNTPFTKHCDQIQFLFFPISQWWKTTCMFHFIHVGMHQWNRII